MRSYDFEFPPEPRGRRTISAEEHHVDYGGGGEEGGLVQIVSKCNEYRV